MICAVEGCDNEVCTVYFGMALCLGDWELAHVEVGKKIHDPVTMIQYLESIADIMNSEEE